MREQQQQLEHSGFDAATAAAMKGNVDRRILRELKRQNTIEARIIRKMEDAERAALKVALLREAQ